MWDTLVIKWNSTIVEAYFSGHYSCRYLSNPSIWLVAFGHFHLWFICSLGYFEKFNLDAESVIYCKCNLIFNPPPYLISMSFSSSYRLCNVLLYLDLYFLDEISRIYFVINVNIGGILDYSLLFSLQIEFWFKETSMKIWNLIY